MKTILVPLDGSALADRAVPFAKTIATRAGWSLLLLRAVNTFSAPTEAAGLALKREAQKALDAMAAALVADGLNVSSRVVRDRRLGDPRSAGRRGRQSGRHLDERARRPRRFICGSR